MDDVEGIRDYVRVSETLATGGQPTTEQLRRLAGDGCAVVVNLGLLDPAYCLGDEAGLAASLGMEYHHIPVVFGNPREDQLLEFATLMDRLAGRKTFVHCAANKRVSCFVALYKESREGWSAVRGDAFIRQVWEPDAVWSAFVAHVRRDRGLGAAGQTSHAAGG
ncbi:MAG: protein tyrosine phosphatase family protein [Thermotogota bacterium]